MWASTARTNIPDEVLWPFPRVYEMLAVVVVRIVTVRALNVYNILSGEIN